MSPYFLCSQNKDSIDNGIIQMLAAKQNQKFPFHFLSAPPALRAWHISDFGNRCELGKIETPKQNLTAFSKPNRGTREARPTDFPPFFQSNSDSRLRPEGIFFS